jgi:DNA-binding NtrC family response regulator
VRERPEDIPLMVQHFLGRFGGDHTVSVEVMSALLSCPWPGNVRELANCIQGMVALTDETTLRLGQLPDEFRGNRHGCPTIPQSRPASFRESVTGDVTSVPLLPLTELERMAVSQAFRHANGNCSEAAALLGIGRTTLYRKLKEYRIGSDGARTAGTL